MLFSIENTLRSRVNKRKYVRVGVYFAHVFIDYHLATTARVGRGMVVGRGLASFFLEEDLPPAVLM